MTTHIPDNHVKSWLGHVRVLAVEIGPRGTTTPGEQKGAEYCQQALQKAGLAATIEPHVAARSNFDPHLIGALLMLFAFAIYPLAGRWTAAAAALLSFVTVVSELLELSFMNNVLRWLTPKGKSQNVIAQVLPQAEHHQDIILMGHIDSQHTPIIFKSEAWLSAYKTLTTAAFISYIAQTILYTIGIFTQWSWIRPLTLVSVLCAVLLLLLCVEANHSPYTAGANDNATAAGLVIALAEHLQAEPLKNSRVWCVCTGSEETQHYGAIDFYHRHHQELVNPKAVIFEMLGCGGPAWLIQEGIIVPFHASHEMVKIAVKIGAAHPDLQAHPSVIAGGNTEMADALRNGIPAICLNGLTEKGGAPYWHQPTDTFDKMDPAIMERNYIYTWKYLQALDNL